jgi:hypothetical protein
MESEMADFMGNRESLRHWRDRVLAGRARRPVQGVGVTNSYTRSATDTFSLSNARYVASKVATDLRQLQRYYERRVAKDRVISTVDPEARHGHKTNHRGYDEYKGHLALDPDSEIITAVAVTPGNSGDVEPVADLIADLTHPDPAGPSAAGDEQPAVYGDSAYGAGGVLEQLENAGIEAMTKVQPPVAAGGMFAKDQFDINLEAQAVTCPNGVTIPIRPVRDKKNKKAGQHGRVRYALPQLPPGRHVHHVEVRAAYQYQPSRGPPHRRPHPAEATRLEGRLSGHPTQGRTQTGPPRPTPPPRP